MSALCDKAFLFGFSQISSQPTPVFYPSSQYASKRVAKYVHFESNYLSFPAYWAIPSFTVVTQGNLFGTSTIQNVVESKPGKDLPMTAMQNYFRSALASSAVDSVMHVPSQPDDSAGVCVLKAHACVSFRHPAKKKYIYIYISNNPRTLSKHKTLLYAKRFLY